MHRLFGMEGYVAVGLACLFPEHGAEGPNGWREMFCGSRGIPLEGYGLRPH